MKFKVLKESSESYKVQFNTKWGKVLPSLSKSFYTRDEAVEYATRQDDDLLWTIYKDGKAVTTGSGSNVSRKRIKEDWIHDKCGNDVIESGEIVVPPIYESLKEAVDSSIEIPRLRYPQYQQYRMNDNYSAFNDFITSDYDEVVKWLDTQNAKVIEIKTEKNRSGLNDYIIYYAKQDEMKESLSDDRYEEIKSKTVQDSDGFWTDYTMYFDHNENKYVFVFGDKEMYSPEDGEFDWEEENVQAAEEWFDSYEGFTEDDLDESIGESTVETISESPMYAYLVTSDMTGMTFAMIHPDKERVTNATGQRMFKEWLTQNHYDDETGEETEESRNAKDSMREEGYYLGWDEVSFGDKDWVEITNWDWNDEDEVGPQSGWTAEIDGNVIPLEIVGSYHTRF